MDNEQEIIELGIVSIVNKGEYNPQTEYEKLNVVTYNGSSYCAKTTTKGNIPTNTDYWQLYAEKGEKGDTGDTGPRGIMGPQGVTGEPGGKPLVASSISGMVDINSVYVNITDGHWYWHNETSWQDGGVYQSTALDTGEVGIVNLDNELQNIIHSSSPVFTNTTGYFIKYNGEITAADNYCYTSPIELKKHQKIMVRAKGANQNVSIISECDLNGNNINPVVICIDSN
ncbi:MAG: collagen-like protein, partial [Methanosphaera sp.]|nr:collagen-like protein [Methanosphaera sp.]